VLVVGAWGSRGKKAHRPPTESELDEMARCLVPLLTHIGNLKDPVEAKKIWCDICGKELSKHGLFDHPRK
jgi:hypothetical protein